MAVKKMAEGFNSKAWEQGDKNQPMDVTFEGAVLATFERNGYDDSDFYAIVWDGERVTTVQYATTRGWTYPNSAVVDATDEVLAQARAWAGKVMAEQAIQVDRAKAQDPRVKGRKVRVTRGRTRGKHPVETGEEGYVVGTAAGYGYYDKEQVILQMTDRMVYLAMDRVEVVDPEQFYTDPDEIRETEKRNAERLNHWRWVAEPAFWLQGVNAEIKAGVV